jgi:Kef-type K+ transport system membrane component KefB
VVPVLKDAGEIGSRFGQLVIAGSTIADFATILLLSLLFSRDATSTTTQVLLVAGLFAAAGLVGLAVLEVERHLGPVRRALRRLQDTTAQIRVRGAFVLIVALCALAGELGLEIILGAFLAGAILSVVDRDEQMTHPDLRRKLEAVGFGVFIPAFFVTSGLRYDLDALLADPATLALVPAVLLALLVVRGVPALLYRPLVEPGRVPVAALLQATSLPFIVAATAIGVELGTIDPAGQAALIAAGLASVIVFPATALALLRRRSAPTASVVTAPEAM